MPRELVDHPVAIEIALGGVVQDMQPHQAREKFLMLHSLIGSAGLAAGDASDPYWMPAALGAHATITPSRLQFANATVTDPFLPCSYAFASRAIIRLSVDLLPDQEVEQVAAVRRRLDDCVRRGPAYWAGVGAGAGAISWCMW